MASKTSKLQLMTELARIASGNIASFIPMATYGRLRRSIKFIVTTDRVTIYSIYYWARWANDGRGPVFAQPDKFLVFFEDPHDDPRIKGDYPRKPGQVKRLTRRQLERARDADQVIVTESVGPAEGLHFLEQGIRKSRDEIPRRLRPLIEGDVRRLLRRGRNKITVRI